MPGGIEFMRHKPWEPVNHADPKAFDRMKEPIDRPFARSDYLRPTATRKVSDDLSREAFGLIGLTERNLDLSRSTSWV